MNGTPPPFLELDSQNHFSPSPLSSPPFNLPLLSSFRCKTRRRRKRRANEPSLPPPPPSCRLVGAFSLARGRGERGVSCSRKSRGGPLACPNAEPLSSAKKERTLSRRKIGVEGIFSPPRPLLPSCQHNFLLEEFAN